MGPSTSVDGERWRRWTQTTRCRSFNGAVDKRRRRAPRPAWARSSPAGFNGAVDKRRRRGSISQVNALQPFCFNGAVDKRRRRGAHGTASTDLYHASMGPSTSVDGERHSAGLRTRPRTLQWGRRQASTERGRASSRWMEGRVLQWGRRQASTESRSSPTCHLITATRFNGAVDKRRRRVPRCRGNRCGNASFNGAVDKRRRRGQLLRGTRCRFRVASMGPSTSVDGEARRS